MCGLHGNLAVAVDAAPASAAVEALDVSVGVAAVGGVEVAEAAQIGVTHHSHGGGARVGHQVEGLGPTPHAQRHGGDVVVGDLRAVLSGCEWYGAVRGRSQGVG